MVEHGAHHPSITELVYPAANFALFVALIVWQGRGPIKEFFRARTERLREALAAGATARKEAEALRAQLQRDLADLPALRERLKNDLRATAERERDTLLEQARVAAERIRNDARLLADQETAAAQRDVRAEVIDEAIRSATAIVRESLTPADQERFVRDFAGAARPQA
ncbi:MAG TPA: ATP synthase F0 subunit B [Candidatus Binatia bacterium]|jgi:F-type H+-transporting ATPase subunit b|nr:ATP synthase F0 subunit B [Candidatus Binatia bacterium]